MKLKNALGPPRHVLVVFVAVASVSAVTLVWLMLMLLEQDRIVERRQELLEASRLIESILLPLMTLSITV